MVKVHYIADADRPHCEKPPEHLVGEEVTITRTMINWHGHWVQHKGDKYVFSHDELHPGECNCYDCREVRELKL